MFNDLDNNSGFLNEDQACELFRELEQNTPQEILRQRGHFRISVKAGVTLYSATTCELLSFEVKGVTGDVSESGCGLVFPVTIRAGDVYRLEFERAKLDLPVTFCRCIRCRFVREGVFETGFRFFTPVPLPGNLAQVEGASRTS
ncbi:MAG: PilZ domain-containing protein [Planctomycetota bacterium]